MSAIVGKIGALQAKLLKAENMEDLLSSNSVPEIAEKLRKTVYGEYIPNVEDIHRRDLESAIRKKYQSDLDSLKKYFTFPEKSIFEHIKFRCEIETVKRILRILSAGDEIEERFLICLPEVGKVSNVPDFISFLKDKPYHGILSSVHGAGGGVSRMENSLDYWYFSGLLKNLMLSRKAKRVVELFREQVDLMNMMWIYRARVLFGYERERVMNLLLPFGKRFRMQSLEDIASAESEDEILSKIRGTPYYDYFESAFRSLGEFLAERSVGKYLYRKFSSLTKNYMNDFEMAVGYLHLLEYEMRNIITVIEAVRYRMGKDMAWEYLVI